MSFNGLRILALESRRAEEIAVLIRKQGGEPFVAPSMREIPLESLDEAFVFGEQLLARNYDCAIFLTGVGTRLLWKTLLTRFGEDAVWTALKNITLVARGPKPSLALRELGLPPNVLVPEPNTWRETLQTMAPRPETRVVVQEYGKSNLTSSMACALRVGMSPRFESMAGTCRKTRVPFAKRPGGLPPGKQMPCSSLRPRNW